jgi:hypothetical protein
LEAFQEVRRHARLPEREAARTLPETAGTLLLAV